MPNNDLVSRLEKCYTGAVYDVLRERGMKNTILPHAIKSIDPEKKLAGKIWTCSGEIDETLDKDIKDYEPRIALNGGIDGYSKIRLVINKSSNLIKKKGKLFLEEGFNQAKETLRILNIYGFYNNKIVKDLGKKNRCIISTKI